MREESAYPLDHPLPSDVAASAAGFIRYQKYAVFSWPWCRRRTLVFGIVAVLGGISFGLSHAFTVKDWWEAGSVAWRIVAANLVLVGAGPMFGAIARHAHLPRRAEVFAVVFAVLAGIVVAIFANRWALDYHNEKMAAYATTQSGHASQHDAPPDMHVWMQRALNVSYQLLTFAFASGAFALRSYLAEPKRWEGHLRRQALEKMSLEKSTADLRLTVLQAQVEPHFLFNTLASVRSLVTSDPKRAAQTIDALAEHLRATLPKLRAETGNSLSTLGEQFAICESYLKLMQIRLGERLQVAIHLPRALRELPFPPLILISLVENAIKHGVERKAGSTHVTLEANVFAEAGKEQLEVRVTDDGAGLSLGMGEGTGLANIRAQLLARFNASASLTLFARDPGGVIAKLIIPVEQLRA